MLVRTWAGSQRDAQSSNPDIWDPQPGLFALIEDVVATHGAALVLADNMLYVSGFQQPEQALVAARQIEIAVQGFRRRHPTLPVAVSVAIDASAPPEGGASGAEAPHELVSLLRISKPAQVLLTHDAFQHLSGNPGLPLKPFPGRFGVNEYLWIGEDQLDLLKSEPQLMLAVITRETPVQNPTPAPLPQPQPATSSGSFNAPAYPTHLGRSTPLSEESLSARAGIRSPRVWLMVGAPLVVVVLIVGIVLSRGTSHSGATAPPSAQKTAPPPASPAINSTVTPAKSGGHAPAAPPVQRVGESPRPQRVKQDAPKNAPSVQAKKEPRPAEPIPTAAATPPAGQSTPCMDRANLTQRYNLAEQNRQAGHYAAAERLFRAVVACDPGNADARSGLDRTLEAEKIHPE